MAIPSGRPKLKTAFKKARSIAPLYTSGAVAITLDGSKIVSCVAEDIILTEVESGVEICRFVGDTQPISSLCITPSASHLLVFTASLSLRIYEIPSSTEPLKKRVAPIRVVGRAHEAPVHVCKADPTSTYLASGSADGVVKVWDILRGYVTHVFRGHGGVVSALTFNYPRDASSVTQENQTMHLITASVDTRIRIFNLTEGASTSSGGGKPEAVLEGHVSVPRGLDVSLDGRWLVSGGRDSVVLIWDLLSKSPSAKVKKSNRKTPALTPTLAKTIPVLERVEAVGFLQQHDCSSELSFYTGGERGVIKLWDGKKGEVLQTFGDENATVSDEDMEEQRQVVNIMYLPSKSLLVSVHADQNIIFHSVSDGSLLRQMIGYNDEIVDATFLSLPNSAESPPQRDSHVAFATNSSLIRVYSTQNLDARLLEGHSEIVLSLDHSADGTVLASGSKDKTARIWGPISNSDDTSSSWGWGCVGVCEGHAESVGAVAMSRGEGSLKFIFTGSQDRTIKMWDLSDVSSRFTPGGSAIRCKSLTTHKAHEKDINSLDISPNDRFLVSGSQDRTAKIFEIQYIAGAGGSVRGELKLLGTCKGHKRGVWTVRFGRAERVLATGSGDKTVKLWSLDDYSCLRTFEGHTNSVLRVDFLNAGLQLVSTGSDGLVKLWNIQQEECTATLDNHEDKVWALAITSDERTIVSGAADSVITFWEDCSEEEEAEKEAKRADLVLKDQDFLNFVSLRDYKRAIQLALAMSQPGRLLGLFKDLAGSGDEESLSGDGSVDEVLRTLGGSELAKLLRYARDWNTNAKTSGVAQRVLFAIVKLHSADDVIKAFGDEDTEKTFADGEDAANADGPAAGRTALKELVDALIPYSERHLSRLERLVQESYIVDYILGEMDDGMFDSELLGDKDDMDVDVESAMVGMA